MRYQAPYGSPGGPNDPTAVYVNGNPSTGTMGSIPPAAAIENPQREIVNFETDSGLTPSDADLHQLSKSVQNGLVNYCNDGGTPNFVAITPVPAIAAYQLGQHFRIKLANVNTGPMQLNANGVGWAPIVHADKTPMGGFETYIGQIIEVAFDGAGHWQMMTGGLSGSLITMTASRSFYVDTNIGSDTLYDGSQATVDSTATHGPFKTLRHAAGATAKYNLSGFTFNIYLANGTYADSAIIKAPIPNGSGNIFIHGNSANPNLVTILNNGVGSIFQISGGLYSFDGVTFQATAGGGGDPGEGLWVSGAGSAWLYAVNFNYVPDFQMLCGPGGGGISISGPIGITGSANGHMEAGSNGAINVNPSPLPTLTISAPVTFSQAFAYASTGGQLAAAYTSITGAGNVTGPKYLANANGVINTGGRGTSYLPGTVAGSLATGGQYV